MLSELQQKLKTVREEMEVKLDKIRSEFASELIPVFKPFMDKYEVEWFSWGQGQVYNDEEDQFDIVGGSFCINGEEFDYEMSEELTQKLGFKYEHEFYEDVFLEMMDDIKDTLEFFGDDKRITVYPDRVVIVSETVDY